MFLYKNTLSVLFVFFVILSNKDIPVESVKLRGFSDPVEVLPAFFHLIIMEIS